MYMKKFVDGGPAQQVTQFQPTFSPAQQGLGSMQQAPDTPAMEMSPQDYDQSPQYAPTQQYGAPTTSYSTPAASPMTAGLGSYMEGLQYKAPPPPTAPAARNYSWNSGKYADEAALRSALGTYATQNNYTPASVDTWMGDQATYGISSTPAAAPSTTTTYNPQTQQYTVPTAPVEPVAAAPAVNYGSIGLPTEDNTNYNVATGGRIHAYAEGGSIPQGIASLGRGQDSMLVHMTPGEVQGLQRLAMAHGGSLTINPQTGLPEAGFLSSLLPMAAAAAAMYFTGGAATPLVAGAEGAAATGGTFMGLAPSVWGAGAGALTGALTNKQSPLMGAITGGISGYTLGGVGEGLAEAGAAPELNKSAEMAFKTAQVDKAMDFYKALPEEQIAALKDAGGISSADAYKTYLESTPNIFSKMSPEDLAKNLATPESQNIIKADYFGNMGKGLQGLSSEQGRNAFIGTAASKGVPATGLGGGMSAAMKGVGLAAPLISSALTPNKFAPPAKRPEQYYNTSYRPPEYKPLTGNYDPASYGPGSYSTAYAAEGGAVGYASGGPPDYYPLTGDARGPGKAPENSSDIYGDDSGAGINNNKAGRGVYSDAAGKGIYENTPSGIKGLFAKTSATTLARYKTAKNAAKQAEAIAELRKRASAVDDYGIEDTTSAAQGGLMGTYAAGGKLLRGPGDGMSDSIPAVIQGAKPQRAALADGEFVIPADVVSHLGNGSTEAGSKRLYSMMDKVRRARTGNPKQGKQINPNRFLPA